MTRSLLGFLASGLLVTGAPAQTTEDDKLTAQDAASGDLLGFSVAIGGTTGVAGAPLSTPNGSNSGSVYLFDLTNGQQIQKLIPSDGDVGDRFGWSVAASSKLVIIGAYGDDDNGTDSGSAYCFDKKAGVELFKFLPSDGASGDRFGASMAIFFELAIVGAPRDDDNGSDSGSVYVFDITSGLELGKLTASDGAALDMFGEAVAISGNYALIGAPEDDDNGASSGSVYVFDLTTYQQVHKLTASDGAEGDRFGCAVALDGTMALVGSSSDDDGGTNSGSAYVFDITTGQELEKLTASDGAAGDFFGVAVALEDGVALIGAHFDDDAGADSGSAYTFDVATGLQTAKLQGSDVGPGDFYGYSVALAEATPLVGAHYHDAAASDTGAAYLYGVTADSIIRYCEATQNPNNAAVIDIDTTDSSSASILVNLASAPANQFVYLLVGNGNATVSQPPGAKGDLCVVGGSCLGRYDKDVGQITSVGTFTTDIQNALSNPCAGAVTITPGATWNFQYWHRQPMGQPATFSDAISVTFD